MRVRYKNQYIGNIRRSIFDFLKWQFGYYDDILPPKSPPQNFVYPTSDLKKEGERSATWINHSTFLIEAGNLVFLTDPIWSTRCSPIPFLGPKRKHAPGIAFEDLKKVDVVLLSHNHYDHLDATTVKKLHRKFPDILWIVPKGVGAWFHKRGIRRVKELKWWEETEISSNPQVIVTSVPAQHHSGRGLFDANASLWMGIVVSFIDQETKSFYFVGDTAYNGYDFKKIGEIFKGFDLSLCPIGTYKPERFMRTVHASPEDAVQIHKDVRSRLSLGMHWRTFNLSMEEEEEPSYDLFLAMKKQGLNPSLFLPVKPGVKVHW